MRFTRKDLEAASKSEVYDPRQRAEFRRLITGETVTDAQIRTLRTEAAAAGDMAQVHLCTDALAGVYSARALCAEAITAARAMVD